MSSEPRHPPCTCDGPTETCPRYGWMLGHKYRTCAGRRELPAAKRDALLDVWSGETPPPLARYADAGAIRPPRTPAGPGTELKTLLAGMGITEASGCNCGSKAALMDAWGVEGCRSRQPEIVAWLAEQQKARGWGATLAAGLKAITSGLAFSLDPLDPLGSLVDEAIRRAEGKEKPPPLPPAEDPR
jgi:hypothetical protein